MPLPYEKIDSICSVCLDIKDDKGNGEAHQHIDIVTEFKNNHSFCYDCVEEISSSIMVELPA